MGTIVALIVLSILIFLHELGHFLTARFFGVKVEVFSIGFGKKLFSKRFGDTQWSISAIPLGGYVKMKGQDDSDPTKVSYDSDSYSSKKPWQKIGILLAGPFANFVTAFVIFVIMASIGLPRLLPYIADVAPNSPASIAKLQKDDKILSINNQEVKYWYQVGELINSSNGMVDMRIQRDDKIIDLTIEPKEVTIKNRFNEEIKRHIIGISPELKQVTQRLNPIDALSYAYDETIKASKMIFKGIQKMIVGDVDTKEIGGVISIVDITSKASNAGILALLFFTAIISVNLGVLNLLPIPALDGGHIMFNLYEMISGKEANEKVMYYLTVAGWIILLSLMLLGVYNDINRILD